MGHQQRLSPFSPAPRRPPAFTGDRRIYWRLSDTVTACVASDRILLLDVRRDRYFALPPVHNEPFLAWLEEAPDRDLAIRCRTILAELKILEPPSAAAAVPTACLIESPIPVDAGPLAPVPIRPRSLVGVASAVVSASRELRARPLAQILARRLPQATGDGPSHGDLTSRLASFRTIRPLIPVPRVCLHDCLALLAWLGPTRGRARLVFGVSAYPFAAHCWVQADGAVLDDHPESPSRFRPILHLP